VGATEKCADGGGGRRRRYLYPRGCKRAGDRDPVQVPADDGGPGSRESERGLLVVHGGGKLHDAEFTMPGGTGIVAGTYLGAVLAAGGSVYLRGAPWQQMESVLETAGKAGGCVRTDASGLWICMNRRPCPVELVTGPYPSFPTDLQSVMLGVASLADGSSRITETIFEERFGHCKRIAETGGAYYNRRQDGLCRREEVFKGRLCPCL